VTSKSEAALVSRVGDLRKRLHEAEEDLRKLRRKTKDAAHNKLGLEDLPDSFPCNASDWELCCSVPGAEEAGERLTKRFVEVLKQFKKDAGSGAGRAAKLAATIMRKAMAEEADYGATDSEPRYHMEQAILDYGRKLGYEMQVGYLD